MTTSRSTRQLTTRRTFLKTAGATAGTLTALSQFSGGVFAGSDGVIKVGLVGCGGRGTGALFNALAADKNTKVFALGDAFRDKVEATLDSVKRSFSPQVDVGDRCFDGFDAYKHVIDCCDFVILATPPHFRPMHLKECVDKGKHVFFEKPVAVDAPGVRSVIESARRAKEKNLAFASGFCYRYDLAKRETIRRIHDGAIGDIVAIHITYNAGPLRAREREKGWTDMQYQVRNWYYFTWLSGDHIVEQHVHNHDKVAWVLRGQMPIAATGSGGRQVRTEAKYGNIYDHHSVAYEYANGLKVFSFCRQMRDTYHEVSDHVMGTKGQAQLMDHVITGAVQWSYKGQAPNMYQQELDEILASIRKGQPINDGESAALSSMMAIMGRMATYSGQRVTWQEAFDSNLSLGPTEYGWDKPAPPVIVAMPGNPKYRAF